ncbi:MAG: tripartite tricarboxylate transporter substrate binding protein [Sphingomonadaceae bacterium]|nr:tripartite tricarboxylate transporter substrate binding protein [Sphingomonadaceae bacterium]
MITKSIRALLTVGLMAMLSLASPLALAAEFPTKPLRLLIPFAPGGAVTFLAEQIMKEMEAQLGQPIVRDYRGGAGGTIAMELAAAAPNDGYTLFLLSTSQAISAGVYETLKVNVARDFAPVSLLAFTPYVLVINPDSVPVQNVQQLAVWAKANPGKLFLGTSGAGNSDAIVGAEFARTLGIQITQVPYRGAGPAIPDLLSGRVNISFFSPLPTKQHVESGKLRMLGVTTKDRSPAMPNIATIAEQGLPGFDFPGWYGIAVPSGTPPAVIATLQRATAAALERQSVKGFLLTNGLSAGGGPSAEFGSFLVSEITRWSRLAKSMGIKPE